MKRIVQACLALLLLILLAVTNPPLEKHQKTISENFSKEHKVAGALGVGFVYSSLFSYRDYVFFSMTRFDGSARSIGALGFVFTF